MLHFLSQSLQYAFIVAFGFMFPNQVRALIGAYRLSRADTAQKFRWMPGWKEALYFVGMGVGTWIGMLIYGYWGWDAMVVIMQYTLLPLMLLTLFTTMNLELIATYNLIRLTQGKYTPFERVLFWGMRFFKILPQVETTAKHTS